MPRHQFTREERQRGGKARAQQEDFREACRTGYERTLQRHPAYARKWLKQAIREQRWERNEDGTAHAEKRD